MQDYEKIYQEFWKEIVENEDGTLNVDQVKLELADYKILLEEVSKVYNELTNFSKPHTRADVIIDAVNERMIDKQIATDDLEMMSKDGYLSIGQIKEYLLT